MSTNNLAVKYRPRSFDEVLGQDIIVHALISYLDKIKENKETIQPLILVGSRGTGKTTLSRIIYKYLNCEQSPLATCDCVNCSQSLGYTEIDASNNGNKVDIQEIIRLSFNSGLSPFKIVFIDECHRLSIAAMDAMLKQLEEPPDRVLYILGSTEENKIPETIKSRCKLKRLSLISGEIIKKKLAEIVSCENKSLSESPLLDKILDLIVNRSGGSLRQAITFLSDILDLENFEIGVIHKILGVCNIDSILDMLKSTQNSLGESLVILSDMEKEGVSPETILYSIQDTLADIAMGVLDSIKLNQEKAVYALELSLKIEGLNPNIRFNSLKLLLGQLYLSWHSQDEITLPKHVLPKLPSKSVPQFPPQSTKNLVYDILQKDIAIIESEDEGDF